MRAMLLRTSSRRELLHRLSGWIATANQWDPGKVFAAAADRLCDEVRKRN
jgi:hypothetical protein